MNTSKLTAFIGIKAETPVNWINYFEANSKDVAGMLCRVVSDIDNIEEEYIAYEKSEVFFEFDELEGTEIHKVSYFGEVDRDGIERLALEGYFGEYCETLGMLTGEGNLPAVSFDSYFPNSYFSFYICPLYAGEVPTKDSFYRAVKTFQNI